MIVRAPASSANLGPGFDCLGLAVDLPFEVTDTPVAHDDGAGWHPAEPGHPATVAYRTAGGDPATVLSWRSPVPPGRGLGYSGAARVAGAALGLLAAGADERDLPAASFAIAASLEGHPDNAAASAHGGLTVTAAGHVVRLDVPPGLALVVWWPQRSTSTDASRRALPPEVPFADATHSSSRAALWVAAVATGRLELLRDACDDRLHQAVRLAERPDAAAVLAGWRDRTDVLAAWLSGSGPTVAALVRGEDAPRVLAARADADPDGATGAGGVCRVLELAATGVGRPTGAAGHAPGTPAP